ncbi:hypothetical protein ACNOYE_31610 [Nannocystaceae bacterium ST9]
MASKAMRRLVVDGVDYLWTVEHEHHVLPASELHRGRCRERFTAYREGCKTSPLRLWFSDGPDVEVGYPTAHGVYVYRPHYADYNLNLPSVAVGLIRVALAHGWRPEVARRPLEVADGLAWLGEVRVDQS